MQLTVEELQQARNWIADCEWRDIQEQEDVDELSDAEVEAGIQRYYDGGIEQFKRDGEPCQITSTD